MALRFETLWNTPGGEVYRQAVRRRAWPAKMGVGAALLVGLLPLFLVVIAALVAGAAVYFVCSVLARIGGWLRGERDPFAGESTPPDPLRENVRVMPRGS